MKERRKYQRLALRLPMECRVEGGDRRWRAFTADVGTGGVYLEIKVPQGFGVPEAGDQIQMDVVIPPGAGYSPFHGRLSGTARILRNQPLMVEADGPSHVRYGIAAQFDRPIHLVF